MLISGVVVDRDGEPLDGAAVALVSAPVPVPDIAALTGPDGRFAIAAPAAGEYALAVRAPDARTASAVVDVGPDGPEADVVIRVG